MPAGIVLHKGNILALHSLHDNGAGLTLHGLCLFHGCFNLLKIMAIDCLNMETKSFQLIHNGIGAHDLCHIAVDLQAIVVHDDTQIIQLVVACEHAGFPNLAFLDLTVAQQGVDTVTGALHLGGQCHAAGSGNALTQRTGGHIHTGYSIHVGVTLQVAAHLTQSQQILHGEESLVCQSGIQTGSSVTLTQHKTVTVLPLGILGVYIQFFKIQICEHVSSRQAAAGMAALGCMGTFNNAHTDFTGHSLQLFLFQFRHRSHCL